MPQGLQLHKLLWEDCPGLRILLGNREYNPYITPIEYFPSLLTTSKKSFRMEMELKAPGSGKSFVRSYVLSVVIPASLGLGCT